MGAWGVYDDENDNVMDLWMDYKYYYLDEVKEELKKNPDKYNSLFRKIKYPKKLPVFDRAYFIAEHKAKNVKTRRREIYKKLLKFARRNKYDKNVIGLTLAAIKFFGDLPYSDPLATSIKSINLRRIKLNKTKIPSDFPITLVKIAKKTNERILKNFDNSEEWRNPKKRIKALENQNEFFDNVIKYLNKSKSSSRKKSKK